MEHSMNAKKKFQEEVGQKKIWRPIATTNQATKENQHGQI